MSQKVEKAKGRPKGLPKTGGRQRGVPNKKNVRMRDVFLQKGFDYAHEFLRAWEDLYRKPAAAIKLEILTKMAPYFMQRLREEPEDVPTPPIDVTPEAEALTDEELLAIASGRSPARK